MSATPATSIRQLPPEVAAKIAAGEVVERPSSVVKELVENALDAGASAVRVELAGGGVDLIRVIDDGRGIPADELPLAFARHATSKLGTLDDLERIGTLGFRGEALASIGSVARVSLLSRPASAATASQISAEEGVLTQVSPAGAPFGTSITVRGLFASVPARLKFLKAATTESGHCLHLLQQYALAYPEVRFVAVSEGREVFATPGDGRLKSALIAVYGLGVTEQMVALPDTPEDIRDELDRPAPGYDERPRVTGYTSNLTCYKSTRQYLSFFVNRRWVQSRSLLFAVEDAYHSLLLTGRHPVAVVNIALDPALLDVNVHPAKTEIKFLRERQVYAAVHRAVREAVLGMIETPAVSPRAFAPAWPTAPAPEDAALPASANGDAMPADSPLDASQVSAPAPTAPSAREPAPAPAPLWDERDERATAKATKQSGGFNVPGAAPNAPVGGKKLPVLRVLGQVSQSYIITEGPDGMYLVDQHAAHERILLERMVAEWRARAVSAQLLLEPLVIELAPTELESVEEHRADLERIGFTFEAFGAGTVLVRAVPAVLAAQAHGHSVRELLLELAGAGAEAASHGETWEEHALANVACKAAIKAGQTLTPEEQRELIAQLEGAAAYQSCCHGRPTMVHLSLSALEREFDRR